MAKQSAGRPAGNARTITLAAAAELMNISVDTARRRLARWGVPVLHREPGKGGQNVYDLAAVTRAIRDAPGQGHRSDLE